MTRYQIGDRVEIICGSYKANRYGTFKGKSGTAMCYVQVDKDVGRCQRRLWLSSIVPFRNKKDKKDFDNGEAAASKSDDALNLLLKELARIRLSVNEMEKKIIDLKQEKDERDNGEN